MPLYEPHTELVDVVDEEGRTLAVVTRGEMRQRKLIHRCTYVLVFNSAGELFIHLRTPTKDVYPSHWDIAVGGVVNAGENFAEGVRRELQEELGLEPDAAVQAEELFPFRYTDENSAVLAMVYRVTLDGPFRLQPEEIVRGEFVSLSTIEERARQLPFSPDGLVVLDILRQRHPQVFSTLPPARRLLLGSGGFRTPERVRFLAGQMRDFFGPIDRLLFIPYALRDYDGYLQSMVDKGIHAGYALDGIHRHADPHEAIRQAQGLFIGGGNTFRLLATLYRFGLIDVIRRRVDEGMPYLGISAGSNVAGPTIKTTNDMPIVQPPSLQALDLVPFQLNPHYYHGASFVRQGDGFQEHFGETRDDRIREFHEMNDVPVVGLWEAGILRVENGNVTLLGARARVFHPSKAAVDCEAGTSLRAALWR